MSVGFLPDLKGRGIRLVPPVNWERDGHRFFLMQSPLAVDEAVERGATRLEDTEYVLGL